MAGSSSSSPRIRSGGDAAAIRGRQVASPTSPGGSEVGSIASATANGRLPNRLGNLHGAGLSSLQLAVRDNDSYSIAGPSTSAAGFNAISTLLNNPNRAQRPIDPSSSRYPLLSQSHTELPKVKRSDVQGYLNSTQKEWERYQRNRKLGSRGKARIEADTDDGGRDTPLDSELDTPSGATRRKKLPPLSSVPQVFFSEDFDLGNPYTFDLVTERYKAASTPSGGSRRGNGSAVPSVGYDVALNQMLQEKLSYYSDVVEQHLILEISARSSSFFAALGNLQELEAEASNCLKKVEALQAELQQKEEGVAKAGLRIISEQAKRREMQEQMEAISILQLLCERKDLCHLLVQNGEWSEALESIDELQQIILGHQKVNINALSPHVDLDLASIPSIQGFALELDTLKSAISSQLESELISLVSRHLEQEIATSSKSDAAVESQQPGSDNRIPSGLSKHLQGLVQTQGVDRAMSSLRGVALNCVRESLRISLCESTEATFDGDRKVLYDLVADDEAASGRSDAKLGAGSAEAAGALQNLALDQFLLLSQSVLVGFSRAIQAVDTQIKGILRELTAISLQGVESGSIDIVMPPGVSPSLPTTLNSIVADVCSATHILGARILSLRSGTHATLPLQDFLSVFHAYWNFILESETIPRRMIVGLRGVVLNQAKSWLAHFHRVRIEKAARAVEEEQWGQAEVNTTQQEHVKLIVDCATSDPDPLVSRQDVVEKSALDAADSPPKKTLEIEERQYFVVAATLDVLDLLVDYIKVVINLPLLSTETMGRVVEFCKQFNSRTCQVVLGAGAMRSAGLKNITAKHLALASQSLSIMITLIPYVRETVRRHLSPTQAVMLIEFDKLKRDYQEHQNEIHLKLVAIMNDRLTVHCRGISGILWNAESNSAEPVQPILDLAKETITLHRVLGKYLQPSTVELVIGQVLLAIDKRISAEWEKVEVKQESAVEKMKVSKKYFDDKFATLKHVQWTAETMEGVIEAHEASLKKMREAAEAERRQKEVPAYKARLPLFGRKTQQTVSNGRLSSESVGDAGRASVDGQAAASPRLTAASLEKEPNLHQMSAVSLPHDAEKSLPGEDTPAIDVVDAVENVEVDTTVDAVEVATAVDAVDEPAPPPTPRKDVEVQQIDMAAANGEPNSQNDTRLTMSNDEASASLSPSKRGTPIPPGTPEKGSYDSALSPTPGARMKLQQRLAEAARRRAQNGNNKLQASSAAVVPAQVEPSSEASTEVEPIQPASVAVDEESPAPVPEKGLDVVADDVPDTEIAADIKSAPDVEAARSIEAAPDVQAASGDVDADANSAVQSAVQAGEDVSSEMPGVDLPSEPAGPQEQVTPSKFTPIVKDEKKEVVEEHGTEVSSSSVAGVSQDEEAKKEEEVTTGGTAN